MLPVFMRLILGKIIIFCLFLSGCGDDETISRPAADNDKPTQQDLVTLRIHSHKSPCQNRGLALCLVRETSDGRPSGVIEKSISGFEFVWGRRYVITVQDLGDRYELIDVLSETSVPLSQTFRIDLKRDNLTETKSCVFRMSGEVEFTTLNSRACARLRFAIRSNVVAEGTFSFTGDLRRPIILRSVSLPDRLTKVWSHFRLEHRESKTELGVCAESAFVVNRRGGYQAEACGQKVREGRITFQELIELKRRAERLRVPHGLREICQQISAEDATFLHVTYRDGKVYRIFREDRAGRCFRGDIRDISALRDYLEFLKTKYQAKEPKPSPTPAPTPTPTPQPQPSPTPEELAS